MRPFRKIPQNEHFAGCTMGGHARVEFVELERIGIHVVILRRRWANLPGGDLATCREAYCVGNAYWDIN
jgi:hypothetical protein